MNESKHPRAVTGLIVLAILCTVALGLQEQRSAPLTAYSPASPVESGPGTLGPLRDRPVSVQRALSSLRTLPVLRHVATRAFWLKPWPWVVVGLIGFGLLAWVLAAAGATREGVRRMERDK